MCKEVRAFPKCTCPGFVKPDSTPGVMTWPELLEYMDNLAAWGRDSIKGWKKQASVLQTAQNKSTEGEAACAAEDLKHRAQLQNKLAGICDEMCKEVGAYPKCSCPGFVKPDSTPGVMTWDELLEYMDNLAAWGRDSLKGWKKKASGLQTAQNKSTEGEAACAAEDLKHRVQLQNKLAGICETMCKEVRAFPKCTCPNFVEPDSTPGVMTWPELLEYMDNLAAWGRDSIKGWRKQASVLQTAKKSTAASNSTAASKSGSCTAEVSTPNADLLVDIPNMVHGESVSFCGAGQLKKVEGNCPHGAAFDAANGDLVSNGAASDCKTVTCSTKPCCMAFKCGTSGQAWAR